MTMQGLLRQYALALLSLLACGCAGFSHTAAPPLRPFSMDVLEPPFGLGRHARDSLGKVTASRVDINHRPVRIWAVQPAAGRVDALYVFGHADGACCPLVSRILDKLARTTPGSWLSFGVGVYRSNGDEQRQRQLAAALDRLRPLAGQSPCRGQVVINRQDRDAVRTYSTKLQNSGAEAYSMAEQLGRPVLLWHEFDTTPRWVPLTTGSGAPVLLRLPAAALKLPTKIGAALSLDGLSRYIGQLNYDIAQFQRLGEAKRLWVTLGPEPVKYVRGHFRFDGGRIADVKQRITQANARSKVALNYMRTMRKIRRLAQSDLVSNDLASNEQALRENVRINTNSLNLLATIPRRSRNNILKYADIVFGAEEEPPDDLNHDWEGELSKARDELAKMEALKQQPHPDPMPVLVDAFLRGWPATFSDEAAEQAYDGWVQSEQRRIWQLLTRRLVKAGVKLSVEQLLLSNVVFRVKRKGDDFEIRPMFVLADPGFQIADPEAGVVRYESSTADQNLVLTNP